MEKTFKIGLILFYKFLTYNNMPTNSIYPHDKTKKVKINLDGQDFKIGDKVDILWTKKDYEGKSVRRNIIDDIINEWRNNSVTNLKTEVERNFTYKFDSTQKTLNRYKDILKGKKACESSVFKRHEEAKDWFRTIIKCIDNFKGAVIIGVQANLPHSSTICPFHISYNTGNRKPFYTYTVAIYGMVDNNHVVFETKLFANNMKISPETFFE